MKIATKKSYFFLSFLLFNLIIIAGNQCYADVTAKILAINDFHGQIGTGKSVTESGKKRNIGSAPVLASYLKHYSKSYEDRTVIVSAGDFVGASPPNSALLQDEPSMMFYNSLGNEDCSYGDKDDMYCNLIAICGNHEFDEGINEFFRLVDGGNHKSGPFLENPYQGAKYPMLCANVVRESDGNAIASQTVMPYTIKCMGGINVGFIGVVLKETPTMVTPTGVAGLKFLDEAETINYYVKKLRKKRVNAIVAIIHQGGTQDSDKVISKPISDIVKTLDSEVDLVISGHSHTAINSTVKNAKGKAIPVVQAYSSGTAFADLTITLNETARDITAVSAKIVTTYADEGPGLTPDTTAKAILDSAEAKVAPLIKKIIANAGEALTKTQNAAGESVLGDMIADAQKKKVSAQIAFMNPGGIRADIDAGEITWGELYTVQPFNNYLVTMTLTGQQIYDLLEQQWPPQNTAVRMMQIAGITYTWDGNGGDNKKIIEVKLDDGKTLDKAAKYKIVCNNFMASGGDNYTVFKQATDQKDSGFSDLDAFIEYMTSLPQPITYTLKNRITKK
jgi:5'-nucleotidase